MNIYIIWLWPSRRVSQVQNICNFLQSIEILFYLASTLLSLVWLALLQNEKKSDEPANDVGFT